VTRPARYRYSGEVLNTTVTYFVEMPHEYIQDVRILKGCFLVSKTHEIVTYYD